MAEEKDKDAQEVDINDADVSAQSERPRGTRPPPLPPEASLPPQPVPQFSQPPSPSQIPPRPSTMPPPAKRSAGLYVILIGAFLVVGLGGGVGVAFYLKKTNPQPAAAAPASAGQKPAVITIPTVEMDDSDAGP